MLAEYDDSSLITLYIRGEELISQERNGEKSYYLYDGFDSVRMLADEDNNITDTYTFDAFGNLVSSTGDTENSYLYRGEQYDSFTGLYYLRARYMNPTTGTFISMDEYAGSVFEPVSLHKYLYANANPVMYTDPTGYFSLGELNVSIGIQNVLMSSVQGACMGTMLGGIFGSVFTWLRGGTSEQIQQAFVDGMAAGFLGGLCFGGLGALATSYWQAQLLLSMFQFAGGYFAFSAAVQDFANGDWIAGILSFGLGIYAAYSSANNASAAWARRQNAFQNISNGIDNASTNTNSDEAGLYLSSKAPEQVTPGTRYLEGQYINDIGQVQPWKAYYDEYGRLIARTDYNAGNQAAGISDTHYHLYAWGPGHTPWEYGSHIEGEYKP